MPCSRMAQCKACKTTGSFERVAVESSVTIRLVLFQHTEFSIKSSRIRWKDGTVLDQFDFRKFRPRSSPFRALKGSEGVVRIFERSKLQTCRDVNLKEDERTFGAKNYRTTARRMIPLRCYNKSLN